MKVEISYACEAGHRVEAVTVATYSATGVSTSVKTLVDLYIVTCTTRTAINQ